MQRINYDFGADKETILELIDILEIPCLKMSTAIDLTIDESDNMEPVDMDLTWNGPAVRASSQQVICVPLLCIHQTIKQFRFQFELIKQ